MRIFLKQRAEARDKRPNIYCSKNDCSRATKYGKEFCSDHIDEMDYAQWLVDELSRRQDEVVVLSQGKKLPRDSQLVQEATGILWEHQALTAPGLTRHIDLTHSEAETLLRSLAKHGFAKIKRSKRGAISATSTIDPDEPPLL